MPARRTVRVPLAALTLAAVTLAACSSPGTTPSADNSRAAAPPRTSMPIASSPAGSQPSVSPGPLTDQPSTAGQLPDLVATRIPLPSAGRSWSASWAMAISATPTGFVAVGGTRLGALFAAESWTSPDGTAWTASPPQASLERAYMATVAANGSVEVAAGGPRRVGSAPHQGVVWTSTDARTWHRVATGTTFGNTEPVKVVWDGSQFVLLARRYSAAGVFVGSGVWHSATGARWAAYPRSLTFLRNARVLDILASAATGIVAVGYFGDTDLDYWHRHWATAWSSPDYTHWTDASRYPTDIGTDATLVASVGGRVISFSPGHGAVWSALNPRDDNDPATGRRIWRVLDDAADRLVSACPVVLATRTTAGLVVLASCPDAWAFLNTSDGVTWQSRHVTLPAKLAFTPAGMVSSPAGILIVGSDAGPQFSDESAEVFLAPDPTAR